MNAWVTLLAAMVGAAIAVTGQWASRRGERISRRAELVLEQCAQLVALSDDFRNRLWEERVLGQTGRTPGWDLQSFSLAGARLRILCRDRVLLDALNELNTSGKALGAYWRQGRIEPGELDVRLQRDKDAAEAFVVASARLLHRHLGDL